MNPEMQGRAGDEPTAPPRYSLLKSHQQIVCSRSVSGQRSIAGLDGWAVADDDGSEIDMRLLGQRLRRLRRMRRLTLQEVAERADVSPSLLSMLERGDLADVSLSRFSRLARVYGLRTSDLLLENRDHHPPVAHSLDRAALIERGRGVTYRLLPDTPAGLEVLHILFDPRSGFETPLVHDGEDFIFVIRGAVTLFWGQHETIVEEGNFVTFPSTIRHSCFNHTDAPTEVIGLGTKPYW
jgi:transcriptional regulator with XRE-family HTH domain